MITSFIRAIPGWLNYHFQQFLKSLGSSMLKPPQSEFTHLIDPAPMKHIENAKAHGRS